MRTCVRHDSRALYPMRSDARLTGIKAPAGTARQTRAIAKPPDAPRMPRLRHALAALALLLGGCTAAGSPAGPADAAASPAVVVYKHASCGCCGVWIEHLRAAGFAVESRDVEDMAAVKQAAGVPPALASCHTARVDGYFIEGHVPAGDITRLLRERPRARGLAVPGMPLGSPGMEHPDGIVQPYAVHLVPADGRDRIFSRHPGG